MLKTQHIVLISRRFWPAIGGAESVMANLASEFASIGLRTTVLTSRFDRKLPPEEDRDGYRIVRIPTNDIRYVGTSLYLFGLRRWLRKNANSIDGVIVSMLKHCASVAVETFFNTDIPVVVRAEGTGTTGDCDWHKTGRFGMRIREICRNADALIAFSNTLTNEMLTAGYSASRIHLIPNGVRTSHCTQLDERVKARGAVPELMHEFSASSSDLIAVYTGRFHEGKGLLDLIRAWPTVLNEHPNAKCWLIGDGPQYDALRQEVQLLKLERAVVLAEPVVANRPVELLLRAADIFVLPSYEEGMSISLLEALACGTACCVSDIAGNRSLIKPEQNGILFPVHAPLQVADTVNRLFRDASLRENFGRTGFRFVEDQYSASKIAAEHLRVIEAVRIEKQSRRE